MRRVYFLVAGTLILFAFASALVLLGVVNTSQFMTEVAVGAVIAGIGLLAWGIQTAVTEPRPEKLTPPVSPLEIHLHQATDLTRAAERIAVKFDLEIVAAKPIETLEVQVATGYGDLLGEWINLDLRQYETTEVEKGKQGKPVGRLSLLRHTAHRFTLITFFFRPTGEKSSTIKVVDQSKQSAFTAMKWISPYPRLDAKFVGLETEVVKKYIIVFPKPPQEPVELLELESDRAKQLLTEFEEVKAQFRKEQLQAYGELLQVVTEIEQDNPVRPGGMIARATGDQTPRLLRVHRDKTTAIARIIREKRNLFQDTTVDAWNNRQTAMKYYGRPDLENIEGVHMDAFIADVRQNYERLRERQTSPQ